MSGYLITFGSLMTNVGYILVALLILMLMIVIHEAGHYLAGKALGFKINEFSIGFGPQIFHRTKKNGEVFSIRPIPLGGYCAFEGEDEESVSSGAFNLQAPWKRLIVLFSGAFFNFLSAIIIIIIYFSCYGQILPSVASIYENTPAQNVFMQGDIILEVDNDMVHVVMSEDITNKISKTGDTAVFKVLRNGEEIKLTVNKAYYTITNDKGETSEHYGFGFGIGATQTKLSFGQALYRAVPFCFFVVFKILVSLAGLITGAIGIENAGGPITIIETITAVAQQGFSNLMYVLVILSANLAVMNLLPLPALDGSKMVFTTIEWVRGKPLNRKIENIIHTVGIFVLFGLTILLDILHIFG